MLTRQSFFIARRFFSSAASSITSNHDVQNSKPFSQIPTMSALKLVTRNLPGGKYHKKTLKEVQEMFLDEFGPIMRMPSVFRNPEMIFTFNADDCEKVVLIFRVLSNLKIEIEMKFS
jgi:hypothetical protein